MSINVLYVEDYSAVRELFVELLQANFSDEGLKISAPDNNEACRCILERREVALLVTDFNLWGGQTATPLIELAHFLNVPVIILSGDTGQIPPGAKKPPTLGVFSKPPREDFFDCLGEAIARISG